MADVDAFLQLDGIKGESPDDKFKDAIQVLSLRLGAVNEGTGQYGSGSGFGKVKFQDIEVIKRVDLSTPVLLKSCARGDHIKKGTLVVRKAGGEQLVYFKIEMTDILITSTHVYSEPGSPLLYESVRLNFKTIREEYTPQSGSSGGAGASVAFGYDIAAAKTI